jgi:hypothetical protein
VKNGEEAGDRSRVPRGGDVGEKVVVGDDVSGVDVVRGDIDGEESDRGVVDGGAFVHGFSQGLETLVVVVRRKTMESLEIAWEFLDVAEKSMNLLFVPSLLGIEI